jgi:hypothetical protein
MKQRFSLNQTQKSQLLILFFQINPDKYFKLFINNFEDLIELKSTIKNCAFGMNFFEKILELIYEKELSGKKYKRLDSFKILKNLIKYKSDQQDFSDEIIQKLFFIYKQNILKCSEGSGWTLSVLLKDMSLSKEQVDWLIANDDNPFVLNRILRHPVVTKELYDWGIKNISMIEKKRRSEVIGIIITYDNSFETRNKKEMIWGIYYSRLPIDLLKNLLLKNLCDLSFDDFIEVSTRLHFFDILENVYDNY